MGAGRHRGEPADETPGVLPILLGVLDAVQTEQSNAIASGHPLRAALLRTAVDSLGHAREDIESAREVVG